MILPLFLNKLLQNAKRNIQGIDFENNFNSNFEKILFLSK